MWFSPSSLININKIYRTALCFVSTDLLSILTYMCVSVIITALLPSNTYYTNNQFLFQSNSDMVAHSVFQNK